ncbi:MAG: hypothetical protein HYV29_01625 [Ignavibacteriales bacterium]|nr:hypothetical protein [Ignavibacteriales bacterium]
MELLDEQSTKRLMEWIDKHFQTRKDGADALRMPETNLSAILNRKRPFGPKYRKRLEEIGGSWIYILTGRYPDAERQRKEIEAEIEERKIMGYLRSVGIDSLDKLQTTIQPMLKVAEKMGEYRTRKKTGK